jgi:hypothetical protein
LQLYKILQCIQLKVLSELVESNSTTFADELELLLRRKSPIDLAQSLEKA